MIPFRIRSESASENTVMTAIPFAPIFTEVRVKKSRVRQLMAEEPLDGSRSRLRHAKMKNALFRHETFMDSRPLGSRSMLVNRVGLVPIVGVKMDFIKIK